MTAERTAPRVNAIAPAGHSQLPLPVNFTPCKPFQAVRCLPLPCPVPLSVNCQSSLITAECALHEGIASRDSVCGKDYDKQWAEFCMQGQPEPAAVKVVDLGAPAFDHSIPEEPALVAITPCRTPRQVCCPRHHLL